MNIASELKSIASHIFGHGVSQIFFPASDTLRVIEREAYDFNLKTKSIENVDNPVYPWRTSIDRRYVYMGDAKMTIMDLKNNRKISFINTSEPFSNPVNRIAFNPSSNMVAFLVEAKNGAQSVRECSLD